MGVIYYVGCVDCKVVRDLDKFYNMYPVKDRKEALEFSNLIQEKAGIAFRSALLVSFMGEHLGHKCVAFTENDDETLDLFKKDGSRWELMEDTDFWKVDEEEQKSGNP
jgi:hypothetical protein